MRRIFQLFLDLWKYSNLSKNPWICICVYFGTKYTMNCCDTAIESSGCKLFENKKNVGYHLGSQRALKSHEWESYKHFRHVYISIVMNDLSILGTMIVPKNIFVSTSDIQIFQIWLRNYSIYSGWVLILLWRCIIFYGIQAFWLKISVYM